MNLQELYKKIELPEEVCLAVERMRTDIPEQMVSALTEPVSYTHLTLPTTPYV